MIRPATLQDAEGIAAVTAAAFGLPPRGERARQEADHVRRHPDHYLVLEQDGDICGSLQILPHWMQVGIANILKGDVGHVAVRPDLQGRGLGTRLMQAAMEHQRRRGFHISRLGGLAKFYSRFGFRSFPRGMYEFAVEPMQGGDRLLTIDEAFRLPEPVAHFVRRYDPSRDWHACRRLRYEFNRGRTGAPVEEYDPSAPAPAEGPNPRGFSFVFDDGQVRGYCLGDRAGEGRIISPCEARVAVTDAAFEPGRPEALWAPLKALLLEAGRINAQRVVARLPFDSLVEAALREGAVLYRRVELQGGPASNMLSVVNLPALLKRIQPELQRRWQRVQRADNVTLILRVEDEGALLEVHDGQVRAAELPEDLPPEALEVNLSTWGFFALLLGLRSARQALAPTAGQVSPELEGALDALFPPQPTATGLWG